MADLDYRNMHLRLAYIEKGLAPPSGDLYAGILATPDEDSAYRDGVKQFVSALLSRATVLKRRPRGSRERLPKGVSAAKLREAVLRRHAAIADIFEADAGRRFQRTESDIIVAVLLRLLDGGIVALPMHDGLMVRKDRAAVAGKVMEEVSREALGYALEVTIGESHSNNILKTNEVSPLLNAL